MKSGAELIIAGDSLQALVRKDRRHWMLRPHFLTTLDGVSRYTAQLHEKTEHFAGWFPYAIKRWHLASDKLAFKRYAALAGLPVPRHWLEPSDGLRDVLIKRSASSFGENLRGPFRSIADQRFDVAQGDYLESFIEGDLLKVWFWDGRPVCAERDAMAFVIGNGVSTLGELIERRARYRIVLSEPERAAMLGKCDVLLRYYGLTLESVLPPGAKQIVEFRYGTHLLPAGARQVVTFAEQPESGWVAVLHQTGTHLLAAIPEEIRPGTLFTVDAVLDREEHLWLLEVNSNPTVHPIAYAPMMESLLAELDCAGQP